MMVAVALLFEGGIVVVVEGIIILGAWFNYAMAWYDWSTLVRVGDDGREEFS